MTDLTGQPSQRAVSDFLAGGGEMGALMRSLDWRQTPLGPVECWPESLRMMVSFLLANRFPLLLWWGPHYISIYNDAYIPVLGKKHPRALGLPVSECWSEIWHILQPLIDTPFEGGPATWMEDLELEIRRSGFTEETHFTVAYSPVPDQTAPRGIGGVLATVHEITEKIIGERRIIALRDLGARAAEAKTPEEACAAAAETLAQHPKDAPFALLYLIDADGKRARLAGAAGIVQESPAGPLVIEFGADAHAPQTWPLSEVARTETLQPVEDLAARFGDAVAPGPWSDPPQQAVVAPIRSNIAHQLAGFLVVGISSRLRLDDPYRSFIELAAGQIATAIANARAYEEERKRAEALAEIDRAKTAFFSNVSHEFRTPLTLMLGPLEDTLAQKNGLPPEDRERLEVAHRNSVRLLKLVNTLLDFSRIEAGRIQASYEPTDLPAFTAELVSVFRSTLEKAGLRLVVDCPPLDERVYVDRDMWEKIVFNLLSNAFKFTFEGEIEVSLKPVGEVVELTVRDTGTGIPADELPRLFERFHRVKGARGRSYEGSGIGLALVQELAKLHGGSVRVESEVDRGSAFIVTIPLGASHLPAARIVAARMLSGAGLRGEAYVGEVLRWLPADDANEVRIPGFSREVATAGLLAEAGATNARVLLADDNADMRDYVRRLLAESGYEVEAVADGLAALNAARERAPDLALVDVMMPRLDGFGLLKELRADERTKTLPVIMLSARAGEESRVEGLAAGADDYLVKPFSAKELLARVGAHLEMARIRNDAEKRVRESEERLRMALSAGKFGDWQLDLAEMNLQASKQCKANFGREPDEPFTYEMFRASIHPDDREMVAERVSRAIAEVGDYEADHRSVWPDGGVHWINARGRVLAGADGRAERMVGVTLDITERKHAEEALREREAWLAGQREALEAALNSAPLETPLGVLARAATGRLGQDVRAAFYLANPEGAELRHVVGMPAAYAEAVDGFKISPESLSCGLATQTRLPVLTSDVTREPLWASWLWLAEKFDYRGCWSFPIHTEAGKFVGAFTVYWRRPREATPADLEFAALVTQAAGIVIERDHAARALRESEARLRALVNASSDVVYKMNADWTVMRNLIGKEFIASAENPRVNWIEEYIPEDDKPKVRATIDEAIRTKSVFELEHQVIRANGTIGWTFSRAIPLLDEQGEILEWFGAASDVTERKRAEEKLRESEERFRNMADNAPVMVWVTDPGPSCVYLSKSWYEFTGQTPETGLGLGWLDATHPDDREYAEETFLAANSKREAFRLEYRLRRKDGEYRWAIDAAAPRFGAGGEFLGYVGSVIDITERKQMEAERERLLAEEQEAREMAERATQAKDEFLGIVSHELRSPLNAILGWSSLLRSHQGDDPQIAKAAETIERNGKAQLQLIEDLLDTTRIITGKMKLEFTPVELADVVSSALDTVRPAANNKGITITMSLDPKAGQISGDMDRLRQVVWNLASNAIKFTPEGGRVWVELRRGDAGMQIVVRDTGPGIARDLLPYVFDRFKQGDSATSRRFGGLGLGLALVKHLVELHGGGVAVESPGEGQGATFTVNLPMRAVKGDSGSEGQRGGKTAVDWRARRRTRTSVLDGVRALVVDDESGARELLTITLELHGVSVACADSAEAAISAIESRLGEPGAEPFDVLISDVGMPGVDGYELIRRLRAHPDKRVRRIQAVALTAYARSEDRLRALQAGFYMHVPKPVDEEELTTVIAALMGRQSR